MLDEFNAYLDIPLNWGKQHPILLSALTGVGGWLLGSVWKYTGDLALSERAKEKRKAKLDALAKARSKADAGRLMRGADSGGFRFGRVAASVRLVDFAPRGYGKHSISSRRVPLPSAAPAAHAAAYAAQLAVYRKKLSERTIFEGTPKIALQRVVLDRSTQDESKLLYLEFGVCESYVHQRAATGVFQGLDAPARGEILRDPVVTMEPFFSNSLGISLAVITSDDHLVFVKRSGATAANQGRIVCGVVEGLTVQDMHQEDVDPYRAAQRALKEELSIDLAANEMGAVAVTGFLFNEEFHEWNFVGHVDLRQFPDKYTVRRIIENKSLSLAHDAWEIGELEFIDFVPDKIAGYMLALDDRLTNYAKVTAILALVATTKDLARVEKAFAPGDDGDWAG